jgi:hypothetical protein
MNYDQFLDNLKISSWVLQNRSFAYKVVGDWQIAFIRMGGKYQTADTIAFVVCVRHIAMRNLEKQHTKSESNPHAYPFKLTTTEIETRNFKYQSKLLNYEISRLPINGDWSDLWNHLEKTIPTWLSTLTKEKLAKEIESKGDIGYIEKIWLEDLNIKAST